MQLADNPKKWESSFAAGAIMPAAAFSLCLWSQSVCSSTDASSSVLGAQQAVLQQKIAIAVARTQLDATGTIAQGIVNMLQSIADSSSKAIGKGENFSATA